LASAPRLPGKSLPPPRNRPRQQGAQRYSRQDRPRWGLLFWVLRFALLRTPLPKRHSRNLLRAPTEPSPYAADWPRCGGARPSLLSALPQSTWPRLPDGRGSLCFAPQAVLTALDKSKNSAAPAVKREAEEDWANDPHSFAPAWTLGRKIGRPMERAAQGSEV
jgi:hypothetical protein